MNEISKEEFIEMMERCKGEIQRLKRVTDSLRPKADAYDNIATILNLLPSPCSGAEESLEWVLANRIRELSKPVPDTTTDVDG